MFRNMVIRRASHMMAWKAHNNLTNLQLMETRVPTISSPSDVLVKVHAASVNPLDVKMIAGYGRKVLDLLHWATNFEPRITNDRYPLTLGRDFSGEIVAAGPCARKEFKPGDRVFGVVEPQKAGSQAQYLTTPSYCIVKRPENLTHNEAASIPYVALTAYSALSTFGCLNRNNCDGLDVLVIGGSGGVGSFAIQLLKLWGANVTATCSQGKIEWLESELFVDRAIDHHDLTQMDALEGRFDFILDAGSYDSTSMDRGAIVEQAMKYLKPLKGSVYVTLSPPFLNNTDQHGIIAGSGKTAVDVAIDSIRGIRNLNSARWAIFLPNKRALNYISRLYSDGTISPRVDKVFKFNQVNEAYKYLESGQTRGKVVVDITQTADEGKEQPPEGHSEEKTNH